MSRMLRALLALVLLTAAISSRASVWFGDEDGLHRVDTATNRADLHIDSSEPAALAVNSTDGSVWALTRSRIAKYSADGVRLFTRSLESLADHAGDGRLVAANAANGSVWVATEKRLLHLAADGALLTVVSSRARDMAVAQDGSLWVMDEEDDELRRYADEGALLSRTRLTGNSRNVRFLALDDTRGALWLAGERFLEKRSLADPAAVLIRVSPSEDVVAVSLDVQSGDLWVLGSKSLFGYRSDATRFLSRRIEDDSIKDSATLAFDIGTQAIWIGHKRGLSRFDGAGQRIATIRADEVETVAVSKAAVVIDPTLALVAPVPDSVVTTARPEIVFQYGALCAGAPCAFPPGFFASFSITALLNGASVGLQFIFDPATGRTRFTPPAPLPQGVNTLSGQAVDATGRMSPLVSAQFTVDSVAPQFVNVTPASGSAFTSPQITIQGGTDDPAARVRLSGTAADSPSTFRFPVTLALGINNFTLTATDPPGNATQLALTYTFAPPPNAPPTVSLDTPANGATFTEPATIVLEATAADSDGTVARVEFLRGGVVIASIASPPYRHTLTGVLAGTYVFAARAVDNLDAATLSANATVSVVAGPPNAPPTVRITSPSSGASFSAPASVHVVAAAADADGTIAKVEFLRNGVVAATVLAAPYETTLANVPAGTHTLTARATDDRGSAVISAPVTITATALALTITSPAPNAAIAGDNVVVAGRITGLPNSGVVVNGGVAAIDAQGNFSALVSLVAGPNAITVTLTGPDGAATTQVVNVTATGEASPYSVVADPATGFAPLNVTFTVTNPTAEDVTFMFDTFGPFSLPAGAAAQLSLGFPAGVFVPAIAITPAAGGPTFTHRIVVDAQDPARIDALLRAIWGGLNTALVAGDKDGAMRTLNGGAKRKYGPVFDTLMPFMGSIVASYSPLAQSSLDTHIGEYAVTRIDGGTKRVYLIYFLLDVDGVWRIDEM